MSSTHRVISLISSITYTMEVHNYNEILNRMKDVNLSNVSVHKDGLLQTQNAIPQAKENGSFNTPKYEKDNEPQPRTMANTPLKRPEMRKDEVRRKLFQGSEK